MKKLLCIFAFLALCVNNAFGQEHIGKHIGPHILDPLPGRGIFCFKRDSLLGMGFSYKGDFIVPDLYLSMEWRFPEKAYDYQGSDFPKMRMGPTGFQFGIGDKFLLGVRDADILLQGSIGFFPVKYFSIQGGLTSEKWTDEHEKSVYGVAVAKLPFDWGAELSAGGLVDSREKPVYFARARLTPFKGKVRPWGEVTCDYSSKASFCFRVGVALIPERDKPPLSKESILFENLSRRMIRYLGSKLGFDTRVRYDDDGYHCCEKFSIRKEKEGYALKWNGKEFHSRKGTAGEWYDAYFFLLDMEQSLCKQITINNRLIN